jgi:hypothetical protein
MPVPSSEIIRRKLLELTEEDFSGEPMQETLLVKSGLLCGRRFRLNDLQAIWFAEENVVKFFDAAGNMAATVRSHDLQPATIDLRRAA